MPGKHRPDRKLVGVWLPTADWATVERAARLTDRTVVSYTRSAALAAARKEIAREEWRPFPMKKAATP